jgi:hypothetical protein
MVRACKPDQTPTRSDVRADSGPEEDIGEESEKGKGDEESQSSSRIFEVRRRNVQSAGEYSRSISFEDLNKLKRRVTYGFSLRLLLEEEKAETSSVDEIRKRGWAKP